MTIYTEQAANQAVAAIRRARPELTPEQATVVAFEADPGLYAAVVDAEAAAVPMKLSEPPTPTGVAKGLVLAEVGRRVAKLREGQPTLSVEQAETRVLLDDDRLYQRYVEASAIDQKTRQR